jgi:predicted pyridoxine 5'-phosphate oxidase superfamily flavin-nucleotide-binding protein
MIAVASTDEAGSSWASLLLGQPGLASTGDGRSVTLDLKRAEIDPSDPLWSNLREGGAIGLLAIELPTRRRLRINGLVARLDPNAVEVAVRESYANCPKYIQRRWLAPAGAPTAGETASGTRLDGARSELIARADTAFVASSHPSRGADASHRGGSPGFLRARGESVVRLPDYRGNGLYNTLGNLAVSPSAGLAVVDFERARILQLTGRAELQFGLPEDPLQPSGTGRYWDLHVARWIERPLPQRWLLG